jgi:proteasome lid subunit RPN8/RPN11
MPGVQAALLRHAWEDAPREACGLLLGRGDVVSEAVRVPNVALEPERMFRLDEQIFVRAVFTAQRRGLTLIGFYHSHPAGLAMPSQTDIAQSAYPDAAHVIIGLRSDPPLAAWRITWGAAEPLALSEGADEAAPGPASTIRVEPLIILSALIAVVILVVLSVALLPPAPRLPVP